MLNNDLDFIVKLYEGENPRPISFDLTWQIMDLQRRLIQNRAANVKTKSHVYFKNKDHYFVSGAGVSYVDLTEMPVKFFRWKPGIKYGRFMVVDLYKALSKVRSLNKVNMNDVLNFDPTLMGEKSRYAWWDAVLSSVNVKIHDSRKLIVLKALDLIFNRPSDVNFARWGAYGKYLDRAVENVVNKYGDDQIGNIENLIPNLFPELNGLICKNLMEAFLRDDPMPEQQPRSSVSDAQAFPRTNPS
ncbi:hypothetical protein HZU75_14615 [Chitinibacter fontanus]|uniref:Uncharacterized protein n=1 Tax=Chitinibacter fontanus TaxID=1737446 RepID=A0A7D5Z9S0_9NEIS|nr:hypothetical protein [Chitinibacter fontanus]QLI82662.1 hypothetical protein HZU75_14615 [Chitinibacter fontanus]